MKLLPQTKQYLELDSPCPKCGKTEFSDLSLYYLNVREKCPYKCIREYEKQQIKLKLEQAKIIESFLKVLLFDTKKLTEKRQKEIEEQRKKEKQINYNKEQEEEKRWEQYLLSRHMFWCNKPAPQPLTPYMKERKERLRKARGTTTHFDQTVCNWCGHEWMRAIGPYNCPKCHKR